MSKLTGPLLSIDASGQIAKTIVFSSWKGIKVGRQYTIPSNPNSAGQQTQRGYLTDAVALWHSTTYPINALTKTNLNRAASNEPNTMSGFNYYVKNYVDTRVAGATPVNIYTTTETSVAHAAISIVVSTSGNTVNVKLRWGYSPTAMINEDTRTEGAVPGTDHTFDFAVASAGLTIYYQAFDLTAGSLVTAGIGRFITT